MRITDADYHSYKSQVMTAPGTSNWLNRTSDRRNPVSCLHDIRLRAMPNCSDNNPAQIAVMHQKCKGMDE